MNEGGGASRSTDPASGSSAATDVSLREYVEALRRGDDERGRERLAWMLGIGVLVWSQIQRRLEILNHENARVATIAERTVSADTYQSDESRRSAERLKLDEWQKEVDGDRSRSITREEFQRDTKREGRATVDTSTKIIGAIGLAIVIFFAILNYQALHNNQGGVNPTVTVTDTTTSTTP